MTSPLESLSAIGWLLLATGAILVLLPFLAKYLPSAEIAERLPPLLLYVYRKDGFVFVTSPIVIIVSLVSVLWTLLRVRP